MCQEKLKGQEVPVVNDLHLWVKQLLQEGKPAEEIVLQYYKEHPDCIFICDEIGNGIVPMEKPGAGIQGTCRQIIDPACRGSGDSGAHHMWNGTEDKIKVKITWIRHGMTQANGEHRYLGKTDDRCLKQESIFCRKKRRNIFQSTWNFVYIPMKRCVQTAELLLRGIQS